MDKKKYAIVILAAGRSSRLGHPKQLVKHKNTSLLNHTIQQALNSEVGEVYVALGSSFDKIVSSIDFDIQILSLKNWQEGMGSSMAESIKKVEPVGYDAVIISVCDQPYISHVHFKDLVQKYEDKKASIVVSQYNSSSGPPTLFDGIHYNELKEITGDLGAKEVVKKHSENVAKIQFPKGDVDIDTEADKNRLSNEFE